ncbi:MAG: YaaA family protein, partial [Treponemataceae bacterium]
MKIIISPAKKMKSCEFIEAKTSPQFLEKSRILIEKIKLLSKSELQTAMNIKGKLLDETYRLYQNCNERDISPAILSYDGIMYKYMGVSVFSYDELSYMEENVFILSGLFGVLRSFDGIYAYRLEMQSQLQDINLYDFWADSLYKNLYQNNDVVLNLASAEYTKGIRKYLMPENHFVDVFFYERVNDTLKEKGVYVKMARG